MLCDHCDLDNVLSQVGATRVSAEEVETLHFLAKSVVKALNAAAERADEFEVSRRYAEGFGYLKTMLELALQYADQLLHRVENL